MLRWLNYYFIVLLLVASNPKVNAQTIENNSETTIRALDYKIKHKTGKLTSNNEAYKIVSDSFLLDVTKTYVVRYLIENKSKDSMIVLEFPAWTNVMIKENGHLIGKTGAFLPFNERSLPMGNKSFILVSINPGDSRQIEAELKASYKNLTQPVNLDIIGKSYDFTVERSYLERQIVYFFLGAYFFIVLYNFFLMLVTKSRAYGLYVFLISIYFFALPHNFGYTIEYFSFLTNYPKFHPFIELIFSSLFGFAILEFTSEFLGVKKYFPRTNKTFNLIRILLVLVLIPGFFGQSVIAYTLSSLIGLFTFGVVLTVSIRSFKRKYPGANYFTFAFSFFILGMFVFLLKEVGVLPETMFTKYSMQAGTTIEAMLFAIALGDRINRLEIQNKEQSLQLIKELKNNEKLQKSINQQLEKKVLKRTIEIQKKNIELEYSNLQITESLNYAKNIQNSILENHNALDNNPIENFVFYKPRDIVSGDFYWSYQINPEILIWITGDCTGHGVPGALLSIVGNVLLNKIVIERGISKVDLVLNLLSQELDRTINQHGENDERLDGMDISVCRLDKRTNTLTFASANSRLWLVRDHKIEECRGEKNPIGNYTKTVPMFNEHTFRVQKDDLILTFTDGFPDQFGGANNKKYGYAKFKNLILRVNEFPIQEQEALINNELNKWQGLNNQVDDITIIGVKIS
ncbi:MAG: SpoIIE family protein phosphatase [Bacteroidetes bacterium]|nr:SpoIIE family protein phosphatase [Bacteroidota bacterium]